MTLSLVPAGTMAADLSGNWTIDGDVQGNPVGLSCVIKQADDAKIAGTCQVNGMEATVEGDSMNGDIEVAGATGKFTGKRTK